MIDDPKLLWKNRNNLKVSMKKYLKLESRKMK
jgi:hypothetical protein